MLPRAGAAAAAAARALAHRSAAPLKRPEAVFSVISVLHVRTLTRTAASGWPASPSTERQPTFTTPDEPARPDRDPTEPLPATNLPVEDYASPLLHTASFFSRLFRYAVYGSVAIVAVTVGSLTALHLYVEHVPLANGHSNESDDDEGWADDVVDGWSGAQRGGGTDPRLGVFARSAIRGAWICQNWGTGLLASTPLNKQATAATVSSSPFGPAAIGGTRIGQTTQSQKPPASSADEGLRLAESYLRFAQIRAEKKGIALAFAQGFDGQGYAQARNQGVDRAAVEIEERLASVRERIGGRYKLEQAREGWERIYYAVSATAQQEGWALREKLRCARKIGDLSARLAALEKEGSAHHSLELSKAEGWIVGSLLPILADTQASTLDTLSKDSVRTATPKSSFFAFWSKSPGASRASTSVSTERPELSKLSQLLSQFPPSRSLDPATARSVLSSLVTLETILARNRQLVSAHSLQLASLNFARSLSPASNETVNPNTMPSLDTRSAASTLSVLFFASRTAVLSTHLAEVSLALDPKSKTAPAYALEELQGALNTTLSVITSLESGSSAVSSNKAYSKACLSLTKDARRTAVMASNLIAWVHEFGATRLGGGGGRAALSPMTWHGGDASAEVYYDKAINLSTMKDGDVVDVDGLRQAQVGRDRVKARLQSRAVAASSKQQ
ncbi:hypothetical protein OIV83_001510 [Microbotryomycetes sp. JL201]|nr:hypothetical protein OIV83_001510 [Microbotryomycetes sp. JL201]